ncbi:2,4-dihydroxyhept-2-ene-1,7-dioic acid aldolase [Rhodococcus sp. WS4]|nr:2,4-dihydroxyhept-2-ene-1,7-dioic acid aldolase [Rhodococcus sp. WS4]
MPSSRCPTHSELVKGPHMSEFAGKRHVVTGAVSGIGHSVAEKQPASGTGRQNRLRERARAGVAYGMWCSIPAPVIAEFSGMADPDYVCIDCQHGFVDYSGLVPMLQAMARFDVTAVVRVSSQDPADIGRVLDAGAEAVIVPMVETSEEAAAVAAACRFPPRGTRSYGTTRATAMLGSDIDVLNAHVVCLVMIETEKGLGNIDAILTTPGVDGVYVGPTDLAISLGERPSDAGRGRHTQAIEHILDRCRVHRTIAGIHGYDRAAARRYSEMGFQMVTCAGDLPLLRSGLAGELAAVRAPRS